MKLIVGLGNPGRKYERTRHNVGFEAIDRLAARCGGGAAKEKFEGRLLEVSIAGEKVLLLWPHTFMNRSGASVGAAVEFYKLDLVDLLIVCDDFNLALGKLRIRPQGSSGGQNGLADVILRLGSEQFGRLRIGIGPVPDNWNCADFVLGKFSASERHEVDLAIDRAAEAAECWVSQGVAVSMNQYNG